MNLTSIYFSILLSILSALPGLLHAQEMILVVERCKALDQSSPIHNIWVDEDNIKWVANTKGLHKVLAIDLVQKVATPAGITHLLTIRGGNAQIQWNTADMQTLLNNAVISSASYDPKTKSLWLGTQQRGAFQVSLSPLRIIQAFNTDNRKLTSNQINDIFIQSNGTVWIATDDGMLTGSGDKWSLQERYLNFVGVDAWGDNMWIMGDDFLWQVDSRGKWKPIAIELKNVEGRLRDIAVDDEGRVWIASNMMTGYDVNANRYQRFGPGQYFTSQYVNCLDVDKDGSIWTGTDDKGLYLIQWEAAMTVNVLMETPLDCKNPQPTAALFAKITGGEAPFQFKWNNGQTTEKASALPAGKYQVTVTDAKGLVKTGKYEIPDPNIKLSAEVIKPASGATPGDGHVNLLLDGGSGIFTYAWSNGEKNQTATQLAPGLHTVTVTDETGCSASITITVPEKVTSLVTSLQITNDIRCALVADGSITATVSGGKAPYRYAWSNGKTSEGLLDGLSPGIYTVTITDAASQSATSRIELTAPPALSATTEMTAPAAVNTSTGQALVKATGGKATYSYAWSHGETTTTAKNLAPGLHTVTVTDANGCTSTSEVNISENITAMSVAVRQSGQIQCHGLRTGSLQAEIKGGKGPYTYQWSTGGTGASLDQLPEGTYNVTVTDAAGSQVTGSANITQPDPLVVMLAVEAAASTNGSDGRAAARATGGSGLYQWAWDNGETVAKATKLSPGLHVITVTDASGCSTTASVTISENILALQITIEQTSSVKCAGSNEGSVKAIVKGGKEPYAYAWSHQAFTPTAANLQDGLYTLTVTDATGQTATSVVTVNSPAPLTISARADAPASTNNANGKVTVTAGGGTGKYTYAWDNGEKEAKAVALGAGLHVVTVTDANGCAITADVQITENILPLATIIRQTSEIRCAGQSSAALVAETTGGKLPYAIKWRGTLGEMTSESLSNLPAGQYAVQVTDANGTSATSPYEVKEPAPLVLSVEEITPAATGNADGKVILKLTGGTAGYTLDGKPWPTGKNTHTLDRLGPGQHRYTLQDASGCTAEVSVTITEDILPLSVSVGQTQQIQCAGTSAAALSATVRGGKPPYTYVWSHGASGASVSDVGEGDYTVIVSDASGLKAQAEAKVTGPPALKAEVTNLRSATNDRLKDGKGQLEVKGGTGPYTYQWSSGETAAQAAKLGLGEGTVTITDAKGCQVSTSFVIREKVLPELTATRLASGEPIRMEKIQFDADSIVIKPEAVPSLDELYEFLYDNPTIIIEVSGHTNSLPADDYCDRISEERASSVADYLIEKGIEDRRIIAKGYGKRKPIASNLTPEGRKRNQRVEIRLIKIEE